MNMNEHARNQLRDQIRSLKKGGLNALQISTALGCSLSTVYYHLSSRYRRNQQQRALRWAWRNKERVNKKALEWYHKNKETLRHRRMLDRVVRMYQKRGDYKVVAEELRMTPEEVYDVLIEMGINPLIIKKKKERTK